MTDYNITVGKDLLPVLLSSQDGVAKLVGGVLNQILEALVTESLGASKHERSGERIGYA
jgi:putative transposase